MWIGVAVVVGGFAAGIGATQLAPFWERYLERRRDARAAARWLVNYRAPERTPEDGAAYPLSRALLEACLRASDAGTRPRPAQLEHPDRRTRLALAFAVDAIAAVRKRERTATGIGAAASLGWLSVVFLPLTWVPAIIGFATLISALSAVTLLAEWKRTSELKALAGSDATPSELAAGLRRLADWPPAMHDPLADRPFPDD